MGKTIISPLCVSQVRNLVIGIGKMRDVGEGGSKNLKNRVTSFMDAPLTFSNFDDGAIGYTQN